jgi:hypothetical protein
MMARNQPPQQRHQAQATEPRFRSEVAPDKPERRGEGPLPVRLAGQPEDVCEVRLWYSAK